MKYLISKLLSGWLLEEQSDETDGEQHAMKPCGQDETEDIEIMWPAS